VDVGEALAAVEVGAAGRESGGHICDIADVRVCVCVFCRSCQNSKK
jgi:hypothetical protein